MELFQVILISAIIFNLLAAVLFFQFLKEFKIVKLGNDSSRKLSSKSVNSAIIAIFLLVVGLGLTITGIIIKP